ncbi:hypothetical protein ACGRHY_09005 [Streptomyces sp. HK10]|uniref:hypothetical protein n=1 Tax=Streptomyces sp. HK10 TaxID=3373255 RepID=UPI003749916B
MPRTADVSGHTVKTPSEEVSGAGLEKADRAECQPIASVIAGVSRPEPAGMVYRRLITTSEDKGPAKILAEELGITDALDCITEGDGAACTETLINVLASLTGGAVGKPAAKYGAPWKWKKAVELVKKIKKHGGDLYDGLEGVIGRPGFRARPRAGRPHARDRTPGGGLGPRAQSRAQSATR